MKINLTIKGQPASKANSRRLVFIQGRQQSIKSEAALEYEKSFDLQLDDDLRVMMDCDLRVTMRIFYSSERSDLDESVILDCLQAKFQRVPGRLEKINDDEWQYGEKVRKLIRRGVYVNDRQVREKHIYHGIDKINPRAEIEIEPLVATMFDDAPIPVPPSPPKQERKSFAQRRAELEAQKGIT